MLKETIDTNLSVENYAEQLILPVLEAKEFVKSDIPTSKQIFSEQVLNQQVLNQQTLSQPSLGHEVFNHQTKTFINRQIKAILSFDFIHHFLA